MWRITNADLDFLVSRINQVTGSPLEPYTKTDTPRVPAYTANIGNYHISGAYGGVKLVRMDNEGGGIETISTVGYGTKRELYNWMQAFLAGIAESATQAN